MPYGGGGIMGDMPGIGGTPRGGGGIIGTGPRPGCGAGGAGAGAGAGLGTSSFPSAAACLAVFTSSGIVHRDSRVDLLNQ